MVYVYVIENDLGKIYIGQTSDLEKRLMRHNGTLKTSSTSYTSINRKGTWNVIYKEEHASRKEAIRREKYLKSHHGRDWLRAFSGR